VTSILREWTEKTKRFRRDAHTILAVHERSRSRIVILDESYKQLDKLAPQQDELLRQALRCVESELYRAAHVMAWAAFMDFLEELIASDGFVALGAVRPHWALGSIEELRESVTEYQVVDVCKLIHLCSKNEVKALHGLLNKRNECAHPSNYYPALNDTLGYVQEILTRIQTLRTRSPR
jgi:hypothetical protein